MAKSQNTGAQANGANDDQYSESETIARAEAALKRMLSTPHQPHKPLGKNMASPKTTKSKAKTRPKG
jgi:hypothetical protein